MFNLFSKKNKNNNEWIIKSPVDGCVVSIEKVSDMTFAKKMIGDGIAIYPKNNNFYSPIDGTLTNIFDTKHAYTFALNDDIDILMHIGIDTVSIDQKYNIFDVIAKQNKKICSSDAVVNVDIEKIKSLNIDPIVPIVIIIKNPEKYNMELLTKDGIEIKHGEEIIKIYKK